MAGIGAVVGFGAVAVAGAVVAWQSWSTPNPTPVATSPADSDTDSDSEVEDTWYDNGTMKCETECLIIGSYGDETPTGTLIAKKRANPNRRRSVFLPGIKDDLRRVTEMVERDPNKTLVKVLEDKPGSQRPRDYYYVQIADFLENCDESGGIVWPINNNMYNYIPTDIVHTCTCINLLYMYITCD